MKSLQKQMADNVQMVNDASKTLGYCTTQLKEQNGVVSAEVTFRLAIDISLRRQGTWRNSPKREFRALKRTIEMPFHFRQTRSDCPFPSKESFVGIGSSTAANRSRRTFTICFTAH